MNRRQALTAAGAVTAAAAIPTILLARRPEQAGPVPLPTPSVGGSPAAGRRVEIANPLRGMYQWYDTPAGLRHWPMSDNYARTCWRACLAAPDRMEVPTRAQATNPDWSGYDWTVIDDHLSSSAAAGRRWGGRLTTFIPRWPGFDESDAGFAAPSFLLNTSPPAALVASSTRLGVAGQGRDTGNIEYLVPNWNSTSYLDHFSWFMEAFAARYNTDDRLGFMDISGYGSVGEWHQFGIRNITEPTRSTAELLLDINIDTLTNKQIVVFGGSRDSRFTLLRGMARATSPGGPRVGLRVDCFAQGYDHMGGSIMSDAAAPWGSGGVYKWAQEQLGSTPADRDPAVDPYERWRTAPVIVEWCNRNDRGFDLTQVGLRDVRKYHVSMLSSGNYRPPYRAMSRPQRQRFERTNTWSGYRLTISSHRVAPEIQRGEPTPVVLTWANHGAAPIYEALPVEVMLVDASDTVAWTRASTFDVRKVLPTRCGFHDGDPVTQRDIFRFRVAPGTYRLAVRLPHPVSYLPPIALDLPDRRPDGSYPLGHVLVR